MNEALYKVTGQVMHAAHMLYLSVAQFHQAVCENKGARMLKERYAKILPAEDGLAAALAVWKTDCAASGFAVTEGSGDLPKAALSQERPPFASVEYQSGVGVLFVADIIVAVEGEECRDPELNMAITDSGRWTREKLEAAATRINEAQEVYG